MRGPGTRECGMGRWREGLERAVLRGRRLQKGPTEGPIQGLIGRRELKTSTASTPLP